MESFSSEVQCQVVPFFCLQVFASFVWVRRFWYPSKTPCTFTGADPAISVTGLGCGEAATEGAVGEWGSGGGAPGKNFWATPFYFLGNALFFVMVGPRLIMENPFNIQFHL